MAPAWNRSPVGKYRVMPFSTMPSRYQAHVHNYVTSCIKCACVPSSLTVQLSQRNIDERARLQRRCSRSRSFFCSFKKPRMSGRSERLKVQRQQAAKETTGSKWRSAAASSASKQTPSVAATENTACIYVQSRTNRPTITQIWVNDV